MAKFTRKNLMVDADKVRELARKRGTSESEAVRLAVAQALAAEEVDHAATAEGVDHARAAEEIMACVRELHERRAFDHIDIKAWWPDDELADIDDEAIKKTTEEDRLAEADA